MKLTNINNIETDDLTIIAGSTMPSRKWSKLLGVSHKSIKVDSRFTDKQTIQRFITATVNAKPDYRFKKLALCKLIKTTYNIGLREAKREMETWFNNNE